MEITVSKLEDVKELKTVSAASVYGTGFLTTIVSWFIELFGTENKMLIDKIEKAKESAMLSLVAKAKTTRGVDGIMNLRFQISGKTVFAYGTVFRFCKDDNGGSADIEHGAYESERNHETKSDIKQYTYVSEKKSLGQDNTNDERIQRLKRLRKEGLITEEEFQQAISKI